MKQPTELELPVLRCLRFHTKYTVASLADEIGISRHMVYKYLVSLYYKGYVYPIPSTYPTVWKYKLGPEY